MKDIISNCFLCGEHSLHVAGTEEAQVMQCINCGYTTSTKYSGTKEENEEFKKLSEDMKNWAVESNGKVWIPTVITLPIGMLYPISSPGQCRHRRLRHIYARELLRSSGENLRVPGTR